MANKRTSHRSLTERWVIKGNLLLETPAHFGNGDANALTDMPLLLDEVEGKPLLPGTSIAGALRNYLRELDLGYGLAEGKGSLASVLFGAYRGDDEGDQSPLIVNDAVADSAGFELRDGVAIEADTRTAKDEAKFDIQLLPAGTTFPLRFELLVGKNDKNEDLRNALATALHGLEDRQITLGARKRRGFGQCTASDWQVWKYDLDARTGQKEGLLAWLSSERDWKTAWPQEAGQTLSEKLNAIVRPKEYDGRKSARLTAEFALNGTLLIRSGFGASDTGPDTVHLHSPRPDGKNPDRRAPVLPGTSWAGVLRHRALKIARTVSKDIQAVDKEGSPLTKTVEGKIVPLLKAEVFTADMFGPLKIERKDSKNTRASRVSVKETEIQQATELVVTRVKIDRFTGGAYESALISEQPAVGTPETRLTLDLTLRTPTDAELGLLLLLLKDLWTGDLPLGGESGIGRGRLKGIYARLVTADGTWDLTADGEKVHVKPDDKAEVLEEFVRTFNKAMENGGVA
jgi:CRISPR/Cas system CSM-associated protein Csm3 (group 7 of RAMP superfamily)